MVLPITSPPLCISQVHARCLTIMSQGNQIWVPPDRHNQTFVSLVNLDPIKLAVVLPRKGDEVTWVSIHHPPCDYPPGVRIAQNTESKQRSPFWSHWSHQSHRARKEKSIFFFTNQKAESIREWGILLWDSQSRVENQLWKNTVSVPGDSSGNYRVTED